MPPSQRHIRLSLRALFAKQSPYNLWPGDCFGLDSDSIRAIYRFRPRKDTYDCLCERFLRSNLLITSGREIASGWTATQFARFTGSALAKTHTTVFASAFCEAISL